MDKELLLERVVKAIIYYNGHSMSWYPKYLELQDNFELIIEEDKDGAITFSTEIKRF